VVASNILMGAHASFPMAARFCMPERRRSVDRMVGTGKDNGNLFRSDNRGIVMAWWSTNYVLGGFLATAFATWAVVQPWLLPQLGWRRAFLFPALLLLTITVLFLMGAKDTPEEADLHPGCTEMDRAQRGSHRLERSSRPTAQNHPYGC